MKFGQLKEHNKRNVFVQNHSENETGRLLVPDLFLFLRKALYVVKASGIFFSIPYLRSIYITNLYNKLLF